MTGSQRNHVVLDGYVPAVTTCPAHPPQFTSPPCGCPDPQPLRAIRVLPALPTTESHPRGRPVTPASSVCQCLAPDPCSTHPDDRPRVKTPPVWACADPAGAVGRLNARPEPGGRLLEVEARTRLPKFSDQDVAMLVALVTHEARIRGIAS